MKEKNETYSILQVSEMTGVTKNRIREWHAKGFLPGIQSISVGSRLHRRFSDTDVGMIRRIDEFQKQGFLLGTAVEKARELSEGGSL